MENIRMGGAVYMVVRDRKGRVYEIPVANTDEAESLARRILEGDKTLPIMDVDIEGCLPYVVRCNENYVLARVGGNDGIPF
jgi:hypothetical protein